MCKKSKKEISTKMKEDKFASCVGWIVSLVVLVLVGTVADGWALSTIWNWFIPPIFKLTTLTLWQAIGVAMVFQLFTRTNELKKSGETKDLSAGEAVLAGFVKAIVVPAFTVGMAYVVLQFAF
jgi:hypothetical protein